MDFGTIAVIGGLATAAVWGVLSLKLKEPCPKCHRRRTWMNDEGMVTCLSCGAIFEAPGLDRSSD